MTESDIFHTLARQTEANGKRVRPVSPSEWLEEARNAAANLETIIDLIDGYVDVKDGDYVQPVANNAMRAKDCAEQSLNALQRLILRAENPFLRTAEGQ